MRYLYFHLSVNKPVSDYMTLQDVWEVFASAWFTPAWARQPPQCFSLKYFNLTHYYRLTDKIFKSSPTDKEHTYHDQWVSNSLISRNWLILHWCTMTKCKFKKILQAKYTQNRIRDVNDWLIISKPPRIFFDQLHVLVWGLICSVCWMKLSENFLSSRKATQSKVSCKMLLSVQ